MMTPAEIAARLSPAQRWCVARGAARYGTKLEAWRGLRDMGLARSHDAGLPKRQSRSGFEVGRYTWRLTPLGAAVRAIVERDTLPPPPKETSDG